MKASINFKTYLKLNINIHDVFVHSNILEAVWFDYQPLTAHSFIQEPTDLWGFINWLKDGSFEDLIGHLSLGYYFDAFAFKTFTLEYPTYCTVDLATLIGKGDYISCGYNGNKARIAPMYVQDPNW